MIADQGRLWGGQIPWIYWATPPTSAYTYDSHGVATPVSNRELRAVQTRFKLQRLQAIYALKVLPVGSTWHSLALISLLSAAGATPLVAASWRTLRAARRLRPGCCRRCSYDLTGNVSGVCPECGTAIQEVAV